MNTYRPKKYSLEEFKNLFKNGNNTYHHAFQKPKAKKISSNQQAWNLQEVEKEVFNKD
jgi:hypothetical protein